ncbi:MAG: PKD domain-containing protein [Euryarchaeota archaeon]|nr:PKD domain-containing protein [Euryarchaeota archaeon]
MAGSVIGKAGALLLVVLTLLQALPAGSAVTPPESGSWYIDGDVVLRDGTYYLNDSVQVNQSGSLTIIGSVLVFNAASVNLVSYGKVVIDNSTVLCAPNASGPLYITVYGGQADFRRCSFDNLSFALYHGTGVFTGCNLSGGDTFVYSAPYNGGEGISLSNCTFVDIGPGQPGLISSFAGDLRVLGCRFFRTASDRTDTGYWEGAAVPVQAGARVLENRFTGLAMAIELSSSSWYSKDYAIFCYFTQQTSQVIQGNVFAGSMNGLCLYGTSSAVEISGNRLYDCGWGIAENSFEPSKTALVFGNLIEGGYGGIVVESDALTITDNTISNCTGAGIYGESNSPPIGGPIIQNNTISGCSFGASFENLPCRFSSNNISDCSRAGIYSYFNYFLDRKCEIVNNTITRCGWETGSGSDTLAALVALSDDRSSFLVRGNVVLDSPTVGMMLTGTVLADRNTVSGGRTGMSLHYDVEARENDIADVDVGISLDTANTYRFPRISSNAVHAREVGVFLRDRSGIEPEIPVTGNVIAAAEGVLADSVRAVVKANDFGGVRGYCVHALGTEPVLENNSWGRLCAGRHLQEWYLDIKARRSNDPYSSGQWFYTDGFSVRAYNWTGARVFTGSAGGSLTLRANLTGFIVDREGQVSTFIRYDITVSKPRVGVGRAPINLATNAVADVQLYPLPDLAVQKIRLPDGRPGPGEPVSVEVSVVHDATYDSLYAALTSVSVALRDNGLPVGEKLIPRLDPNATATVRFGWTAQSGRHELVAMADPDLRIAEAFEENNLQRREVLVNEVPVPVLAVSDLEPAAGRPVAFSSSGSTDDSGVVSSLFDFGDGTDSGWTAASSVLHSYLSPGVYPARLRVADAENARSEWSLPEYVTVREGSLAVSLLADDTRPDTLVPVVFTASATGSAGEPKSFTWVFGDGTTERGTSPRASHAYGRPGNFTASVTVQDSLGWKGSTSLVVSVRNRPPNAAFSHSPARPTVLTPVQFESLSGDPDGVVTRWLWDLGDGNRSADPAPRHLYLRKGDYTVTLSVQDDLGAQGAAEPLRLSVENIPPVARISPASATVRAGAAVTLDGLSTLDPDDAPSALEFRWSGPDGWYQTGERVLRRFEAPGPYRVTLTVTDGSGATSRDTAVIEVLAAGQSGDAGMRPVAVALSAAAVALFVAALWIFGHDRTRPAEAPRRARGGGDGHRWGKRAGRPPAGRPPR